MVILRNIFCAFMLLFFLQACSVGMAISGSENPDLGAVGVGKTRGEVEQHLGPPIETRTLDNGNTINVYEYEIGNEPSIGRAAGHAAMDVLTFGIWEIVGTPIEGFAGEKYKAHITYSDKDVVLNIRTNKVTNNQ